MSSNLKKWNNLDVKKAGILMKKHILIIILSIGVLGAIFKIVPYIEIIPKRPVVKHGEFPFCLTFEYDGEIHEVKDTLICDYDGFAADAARGIYRKWKSCLKSGKERITLFKEQETEIFFSPNINHWEAGAFFMGDNEIYDKINIPFPDAWYTDDFESHRLNAYIISADELWDKYKIKLLSWDIASPIKNEFKGILTVKQGGYV